MGGLCQARKARERPTSRLTPLEHFFLKLLFEDLARRGEQPGVLEKREFLLFIKRAGVWSEQLYERARKRGGERVTLPCFLETMRLALHGSLGLLEEVMFDLFADVRRQTFDEGQFCKMVRNLPHFMLPRLASAHALHRFSSCPAPRRQEQKPQPWKESGAEVLNAWSAQQFSRFEAKGAIGRAEFRKWVMCNERLLHGLAQVFRVSWWAEVPGPPVQVGFTRMLSPAEPARGSVRGKGEEKAQRVRFAFCELLLLLFPAQPALKPQRVVLVPGLDVECLDVPQRLAFTHPSARYPSFALEVDCLEDYLAAKAFCQQHFHTSLETRYVLEKVLRKGRRSTLYQARGRAVAGPRVAVREVEKSLSSPSEGRAAVAGPRLMADIAHEGLVGVLDVFDTPGCVYQVMELGPMATLTDLLAACPGRRLPERTALMLVHRVLQTLDHLHSLGVAHQDISPSAVLVEPTQGAEGFDAVKLCCFDRATRASRDGEAPGDSFAGEETAGERVSPDCPLAGDIYALGRVFYFALTGTPKTEGYCPSIEEDLLAPARFCEPQLRRLAPPTLDLLAKLLEQDPRRRPSAPAALKHAAFCPPHRRSLN